MSGYGGSVAIISGNYIVIPDSAVALNEVQLLTGYFLGINSGSMYFRTGGGYQFTDASANDLFFVRSSGFNTSFAGRKRVAADVTNATTTFSNITGLSETLEAGRHYTGRLVIKCSDSTAAEGIKFDFNGGSATMTAFAAGAGIITGGTAVAGTTVSSALATALNWTTITNETWVAVEFSITVNAAGTFIPRFAQNSHTTGTATVSRGTYMEMNDTV